MVEYILAVTLFTVTPETLATKTEVQKTVHVSYQKCKDAGAAELKKLEGENHKGAFFTCRRK